MKILSLYICNYGSWYGRHHIPLAGRGLVSVLGENLDDPGWSNGSGKSTWSDALDWCLWGEHPRGEAVHTVVNEQMGKDCCVTAYVVDDDEKLLQVTRTRAWSSGKDGPRLWVNGDEVTALDATETQRLIGERLGLDREVFHAAVLFAQGDNWQFADAKDSERKALLTRIIPEMGEVDVLAAKTEKLLEMATAEAAAKKEQLARGEAAAQTLLQADPRPRVQQWEEQRTQNLWSMAQLGEDLLRQIGELQQSLSSPPQQQQLLPPHADAECSVARSKASALYASLSSADVDLGAMRRDAAQLRAQLQAVMAKREGPCGACGQMVSGAHLQAEVVRLQAEFTAAVAKGQAAADARAALEQRYAVADKAARLLQSAYDSRKASHEAAQQQFATAQQQWKAGQVKLSGLIAREQQVRTQYEAAKAQTNPVLADVAQWEKRVQQSIVWMENAQRDCKDVERRCTALGFWKTGLGAKGLKSYVLDGKIAEMAAEANRWVQHLTGGTIWVEFSTQREVGKGKARKYVEDLSIRVLKSNPDGTITERGYRNWSGGEKSRVALGIDFGLVQLIAKRAKRSYDLLILDEVFQKSLDAAGKAAVAEMLGKLSEEKSSIFVIDHEPQFQNMFDERMTVRKHARRSWVADGNRFVPGTDASGHLLEHHSAFPE